MAPKNLLVSYLCLVLSVGPAGIARAADDPSGTASGTAPDTRYPGPSSRPAPTLLNGASDFAGDLGGKRVASSRPYGSSVLSTMDDNGVSGRGAEFISGYYPGAVLMPVRLWGAVRQTGVHHVPARTDLTQLLTLAGGPTNDAELDEVAIQRTAKDGSFQTLHIDLKEFVRGTPSKPVELEPGDVVIVPAAKPLIGPNALTMITVITSIIGVTATVLLVSNQLSKK